MGVLRRLLVAAATAGLVFSFGALPAQSNQVCVMVDGDVQGTPIGTGETPLCVPPENGGPVPGVPGLPLPPPIPSVPTIPTPVPIPALPVP